MDKKESFIYKQVIKFNQSNDFLEAVKKRNIEACKKVLLLKPNAIVSKTIDKEESAIHIAVENKDYEMLEFLKI
jgi:hypothetical protein